MTRASSILSLVLAMLAALVAAVPAGASEGYRSVDSILASGGTQATTQSGNPGSVKPLFVFAGTSGDRSPSGTGGGDYRSADAVLAVSGSSQPSFVSGWHAAKVQTSMPKRFSSTPLGSVRSPRDESERQ